MVGFRYTGRNENFVPARAGSRGDLEPDSIEERVQLVGEVLVEAVGRAAHFVREGVVAAEWRQQTGSKGSIDFFE